jgi:hypothetical protein
MKKAAREQTIRMLLGRREGEGDWVNESIS